MAGQGWGGGTLSCSWLGKGRDGVGVLCAGPGCGGGRGGCMVGALVDPAPLQEFCHLGAYKHVGNISSYSCRGGTKL